MDVLDLKKFPSERTGYILPPGLYELVDNNKTPKCLLPNIKKGIFIDITIDDIRLRSNFKNNQTLIFTIKSFFCTKLGFIQSHSRPLCEINKFVHLIPGTYKSEKPFNTIGNDKIHLKADCIL